MSAGLPPPPPPPPPPPSGAVPSGPLRDEPFSEPVDRRARSAAAAFRVPFSVLDAGVAILAYFGGQVVVWVLVAVVAAFAGYEPEGTSGLAIGIAASVGGFLLALAWLRLRRRLTWRLLGPVRPGAMTLAIGLAVGFGGTLLAYLLNAALLAAFGADEPVDQQVLQDALAGGLSLVLAVLLAVVAAPVIEEVLFRGLLFQSLRRRLGLWPAALLSSAVFTVVHVEVIVSQPIALAGLFALGVVFAWACHRFGSVVVPIVAHAVFNGTSVMIALLADRLGIVAWAALP